MKKEDIGTLARAITTAVVAILGVLTILGFEVPVINENAFTAGIAAVLYVLILIWNHWKNNDYTIEAKTGTRIMREMKEHRNDAGSPNSKGGER